MLQGDVGSGKTAVAFLALMAAAGSGMQAALMAPTEILASQHFQRLEVPQHVPVTTSMRALFCRSQFACVAMPVEILACSTRSTSSCRNSRNAACLTAACGLLVPCMLTRGGIWCDTFCPVLAVIAGLRFR